MEMFLIQDLDSSDSNVSHWLYYMTPGYVYVTSNTSFVIKTELLSLEQNSQFRTSLVVQWLRVCTLPIQGAWV